MPERGARMPIRSGLFCAIAGANTPDAATADAHATNLRRDSAIVVLPFAALWTAFSVHQTHVSNKLNRMEGRARYAAAVVCRNASTCAPVSVQSLSKFATISFINGCDSAIARCL